MVETKKVKVSWNLFYAGWRAYLAGKSNQQTKTVENPSEYPHWLRGWEAAKDNV